MPATGPTSLINRDSERQDPTNLKVDWKKRPQITADKYDDFQVSHSAEDSVLQVFPLDPLKVLECVV